MTYRRFRLFVAVPLIAAILLGLGSRASHAGQDAANAYSMGWCLGVASYQAAVNEEALAYDFIVSCAQPNATRLTLRGPVNNGTIANIVREIQSMCCAANLLAKDLHEALVILRQQYEGRLKAGDAPTNKSDAYRLGLIIGLAEGQCTSPVFNEAGAWFLAHDALDQARTLVTTSSFLSKVNFNRSLLDEALTLTDDYRRSREGAYNKVVELRNSYGNVVIASNL